MGKSGRDKKLKRQEKSKTKLKGVKTLLKAQNIVNPVLRVKKILVREQLVSAPDGVITTKRKQTLHDVLSGLKHHNTNRRKEALADLQELVTDSTVLSQSLGEILERIGAMTSDLETSVRKENLKVTEAVFQRVEEYRMQSFWNSLLLRLKCSLTHFNPGIRNDTLPFMELLVTYFPRRVSQSNSKILPSLLSLIATTPGLESTPTSSITPNNQLRLKSDVSKEVRERVLTLIGSCLKLKEEHRKKSSFVAPTISISEKEDCRKEIYLGLLYPMGYDRGILRSSLNAYEDPNIFSEGNYTNRYSNFAGEVVQDLNKYWPTFVQSILSVLTETWVEAGPSQLDSNNSSSTLAEGNKSKRRKSMASAFLEPQDDDDDGGGGGGRANNKSRRKSGKVLGSEQEMEIDFHIFSGSDKRDAKDVVSTPTRKRGGRESLNLTEIALRSLSCILNVMVPLLISSDKIEENDQLDISGHDSHLFMKTLGKEHGPKLRKCFFRHLPYKAKQDNKRGVVTTLNLKLFHIAAQLRLMDSDIFEQFETYINELVNGQVLDSEECHLILRILSCTHHTRQFQVATNFIVYALKELSHWDLLCTFLAKILDLRNRNNEESFLDWKVVTSSLMENVEEITQEFLTLLTYIALRKYADVKEHLKNQNTMAKFQGLLQPSSSTTVWNECIRLFYYLDAGSEFKKLFDGCLPPCTEDLNLNYFCDNNGKYLYDIHF